MKIIYESKKEKSELVKLARIMLYYYRQITNSTQDRINMDKLDCAFARGLLSECFTEDEYKVVRELLARGN